MGCGVWGVQYGGMKSSVWTVGSEEWDVEIGMFSVEGGK